MTSWPDKFQRDLDDNEATLSYRMDVMDPAILSLKAKMMRRPTLYQVSPSVIHVCHCSSQGLA